MVARPGEDARTARDRLRFTTVKTVTILPDTFGLDEDWAGVPVKPSTLAQIVDKKNLQLVQLRLSSSQG